MFQLKKTLVGVGLLSALVLTGCDSQDDVGDVSLGFLTLKDVKINYFVDPVVTGVTCHVASIEANLSLSDPSNNSVECHQTGPITPEGNTDLIFSTASSVNTRLSLYSFE